MLLSHTPVPRSCPMLLSLLFPTERPWAGGRLGSRMKMRVKTGDLECLRIGAAGWSEETLAAKAE